MNESEDSNNGPLVAGVLGPLLFLGLSALAIGYYRCRHKAEGESPSVIPGPQDTNGPRDNDIEQGDLELKTTLVSVPTDGSNYIAEATGHESRILTPAETCRKANLFFPGFVDFCDKFEFTRDTHEGIRWALHRKLSITLHKLCSKNDKNEAELAGVEELMKQENAVELCIALGMDGDLVRLRFLVVRNFEEALDIPTGKTHIIHSIQHLIDTIHVDNPFGGASDRTGKIVKNFRGKKWLSYLGVDWTKDQLVENVKHVEHVIEHSDIKKGFYVHGLTGRDLECVYLAGGKVPPSHSTETIPHDFGDGVYCFKEQIRWALSFAVSRCWPVHIIEGQGPVITSCNPAIILFPKPVHAIIKQNLFEVGKKQRVMGKKAFKKHLLPQVEEGAKNYEEFMEAREKWKNDKELRYWKDFVKLSLCYQQVPNQINTNTVVCGLMHDCREGMKPSGVKAPVPDPNGWIQYCFRNGIILGVDRLFIEFNMDWTEWVTLESITDMAAATATENSSEAITQEQTKWAQDLF